MSDCVMCGEATLPEARQWRHPHPLQVSCPVCAFTLHGTAHAPKPTLDAAHGQLVQGAPGSNACGTVAKVVWLTCLVGRCGLMVLL